jgi:hypothetical protein
MAGVDVDAEVVSASGSDGAAVPGLRPRWLRSRVSEVHEDRVYTVVCLLAVVGAGTASLLWPREIPSALQFPIIVVAGLLLAGRRLLLVYGVALGVLLAWAPFAGLSWSRATLVVLSFVAVMAVMYVAAESRALLGTRGFGGDRMFADLRDRISSGGHLPDLPAGWRSHSVILSAHGDRFSGDFLVAHLSPSGDRLEIVLVDVSGKGTRAGTRALLLSGALGGLLGAVPSAEFLRAANDYLVRQGWAEGFATAIHLDLDLSTGDYSVANAGHPSAARYTSGRARWTVLDGDRGPLLGVVPGVSFSRQFGRLDRGDALLLYSDGIIESRGRDLTDGIDRMLGVAAMSVLRGGDIARDVCESARSGEDDDRAAFAVLRL